MKHKNRNVVIAFVCLAIPVWILFALWVNSFPDKTNPNSNGISFIDSIRYWTLLVSLLITFGIQALLSVFIKIIPLPNYRILAFILLSWGISILLTLIGISVDITSYGYFMYLPIVSIGLSIACLRWWFPSWFLKQIEFTRQEEKKPVDDTPLPNTPEFDEKVAKGLITVLPTNDRILSPKDRLHGSAFFLPEKKKEEETVKNPNHGLWLGGGFFHHREGNLLTVAAPGSGKGASLIIPNLLYERDYPHSFVVFDPKGTNAAITATYQKKSGQKVIILDPAHLQKLNNAQHGIKSSSLNPLDFIGDNIVKGCGQIANFLLPDNPHAKEKIWNQEARDLIQALLMHIMTYPIYEGQRNLVTLYNLVRKKDWDEIISDMYMNREYDYRIRDAAKKLQEMRESSDKIFGSVVFSAGEATNFLKDPDLQKSVASSDFNPADFDKGGITLYLCIPIDSVELYATWGRIIIGLLLHANARPSGREKAWCYYLLDEFPTMGVFPEVIKALAFSREFKMRVWLFAQNLAQLDRIYTEHQRKEILGTCGVFQAFSVNEPTTANYVSDRLGTYTEEYVQQSYSSSSSFSSGGGTGTGGSTTGSSSSYSINKSSRKLLFADEVEKEKNIITFSEIGCYRLSRWMYWMQPKNSLEWKYFSMMSARAEKNINYTQSTV